MQADGSPAGGPADALRSVLDATRRIGASLAPLDVDQFVCALAVRDEALRSLAAVAEALPSDAPDPLQAALQELSDAILQQEEQNRALAQAAFEALRENLKSLQAGNQALSGYRSPPLPEPRFSDRKG